MIRADIHMHGELDHLPADYVNTNACKVITGAVHNLPIHTKRIIIHPLSISKMSDYITAPRREQ